MKKAVTIKDISEQLGLSRNTVAKALNGQYVPEKTRELVLKKATEMNYKSLNLSQTDLSAKKYRILLISGKPLNNMPYFVPIIREIENHCYEKNFELFQYTYNKSRSTFSEFCDYIKKFNANGIIAIECFDKNFNAKIIDFGKPIVFVDFTSSSVTTHKNFDIIAVNDEQSISSVVKLLHKTYGTQRFTFVGDRQHCLSFYERYMGMRKGILSFSGEHSKKEDILCNDDSFDYGNPHSLKTEILKLKYMPECFVCCNDFVARTVCDALHLLGMKTPQNAMVVGFDNNTEATARQPALTSFSVAKEFMGRETLRTLVSRIENPDAPSRTIIISTELVWRDSTDKNLRL